MARLRIGAVSYLNTKPLVYQLDEFIPDAEIIFDLPSRLADQLAAGHLDIGLIPSVEYFQDATYTVVSDACIACRGPVLSVKLLSRVPVEKIRSLALDEGSRTSAALVRILLQQRVGVSPVLETLPIGMGPEETQADAVLLIGDRAIQPRPPEFVESWDLGEQWCGWANVPFVFAMWVARSAAVNPSVVAALEAARDAGQRHIAEIADTHARAAGLANEECIAYLRDYLHFQLGPEERQGLEMFRRLAADLGYVDSNNVCH